MAAMIFDEPEADAFGLAIEADTLRLISAGSYLEASLVVEARLGEAGAPTSASSPGSTDSSAG